MQDGYTTGNGLGLGLPGTRRLVDDFELDTAPGAGTTIRLVKWTPCLTPRPSWPAELELGIAERPLPGQARSGDRAVLAEFAGGALVAAIDGLGHGEKAADAAAIAAERAGRAPRRRARGPDRGAATPRCGDARRGDDAGLVRPRRRPDELDRGRQRRGPARPRGRGPVGADRGRVHPGRRRRLQPALRPRHERGARAGRPARAGDGRHRRRASPRRSRPAAPRSRSPTGSSPSTPSRRTTRWSSSCGTARGYEGVEGRSTLEGP